MEVLSGVKSGEIKTQGIKYSGSKLKLLPSLLSVIASTDATSVFDGFSGTTRVSQALAQRGYSVTSNDHAVWSRVFAECYLLGVLTDDIYDKIRYLNSLPGVDGWFTEKYGGLDNNGSAIQNDGRKRLWQIHNTKKLDAIRPAIDEIASNGIEKSILITSLIRALDAVDSTLGHFVSYLKDWSPRSYNLMELKAPQIAWSGANHHVYCADIFDVTSKVDVDLSYFDPPYGSNNEKMPPSRVRYASYYHIWKTICLNDFPETVGVAERRADASDSVACSPFEDFRRDQEGRLIAVSAIERLIGICKSRYILLSYSNGGRATKEELLDILNDGGAKLKTFSIDHRRNVMSDMRWTNEWIRDSESKNEEFLFLLDRG